MKQIAGILREVPMFSGCSEAQLANLAQRMTEKHLGPNEYLTRQGEEGKNFYVIVGGHAEVVKDGAVIGQLTSGDYCGEVALLNDSKRAESIRVAKSSIVHTFVIHKQTFRDEIQRDLHLVFYRREAIDIDTTLNDQDPDSTARETNEAGMVLHHPGKQELQWLLQAVAKNLLFEHMTVAEQTHVLSKMHQAHIGRRQALMREGDKGNSFYVIRSGQFEVSSQERGHICYLSSKAPVGELALIYNAPRSATVVARTNAILWAIDRATLRKAVKEMALSKNRQITALLQKVPLLSSLSKDEIARIAAASFCEENFSDKDVIIREGDAGDKFYILKKGEVEVFKGKHKKRVLKSPGYFGEKALLSQKPRSCTLTSKGDSTCYSLSSKQFKLVLGPLADLLKRRMSVLYADAALKSVVLKKASAMTKVKEKNRASEITQNVAELIVLGRLGVGGYGVVNLVRDPKTKGLFALKFVRKDMIERGKQQKAIKAELEVMRCLDNLFVVNLYRTYQDRFFVFFLCDLGMAGDLFHYMAGIEHLSTAQVLFYSACVVEALEHIHSFDVVFRDLKPENIVICADGYLKLTDYGLAKFLDGELTFTLCGTPDYLAPEVILGRGYDPGVDWWGLGVLLYEMIARVPPFIGKPATICEKILTQNPKFGANKGFSKAARSLINRLCAKNPARRLGSTRGGAKSIRRHAYYVENEFKWRELRSGQMKAPHIPDLGEEGDMSHIRISLKPDPSKPTAIENPDWAKAFG